MVLEHISRGGANSGFNVLEGVMADSTIFLSYNHMCALAHEFKLSFDRARVIALLLPRVLRFWEHKADLEAPLLVSGKAVTS